MSDFARCERIPKVTIITVCYNSADTIRHTVDSVLSQSYPSIEYIIIDGGSTDGTSDVIAAYGGRIDVVVSERDEGIYDAINKGIKLATGDIIGTLNSDDFYIGPEAISELVSALLGARADAAFADLVYVDRKNLTRAKRYFNSGLWRPGLFRIGLMPAHPTFIIWKKWYSLVGAFSLDYKIAADFDMLVRLLHRERASYVYVAKPLVIMRMGGVSTRSIRQRLVLNREIVRACRANGIWTALPLLLLKLPIKFLELLHGAGRDVHVITAGTARKLRAGGASSRNS